MEIEEGVIRRGRRPRRIIRIDYKGIRYEADTTGLTIKGLHFQNSY